MLFLRCSSCDCVVGCVEEGRDKKCYDCDKNKTCVLYTTEDYQQLFADKRHSMIDCLCDNCRETQKFFPNKIMTDDRFDESEELRAR